MSEPDKRRPPNLSTDVDDLFEFAACGCLTIAPSGRIRRANTTFARWVARPSAELVGSHFRDLLTVPSRIFFETTLAPMLRLDGEVEEMALDLLTRAGGPCPVLVNAVELRDAQGVVEVIHLGVMRAKSRRGYERDLQSREASARQRFSEERATAELREQFIAVLGHDLRNPLAAIGGGSRLLQREPQSERSMRVLKLMDRSVERMTGLIDDVLDFARARLGSGITLDRAVDDLEPTLRQVVSEFEVAEPGRIIDCRFDLSEAVSFDEGRLAQLLSNLLGNALTHGDPGQPIRLEASTFGGKLLVAVVNGGAPIPPAAMARLFQPFFRGEVRPSQNGLGLGLHIAAEIARAHGGDLEVHSDDNETRFTFSMPAQPGIATERS